MDPVPIAIMVGLAVAWLFASWQVARGRRRFKWVFFVPGFAGFGAILWAALGSAASGEPALAGLLLLIAAPTLVLFARMAKAVAAEPLYSDPKWELSSAQFDYIIWLSIGLPILAVVGIVGLLILVALNGT